MLLYIDELLEEIDSIKEYAEIISEKFDQQRECNELLLDAKALQKRLEYFFSVIPDGLNATNNAFRHMHFMIHYLEKDRRSSCEQDIKDILQFDLPEARNRIKSWANNLHYVDADIRSELSVLIRTGQFDSAIRKAFVLLKTRICERYEFSIEIDGGDLVNKLFGKDSIYFVDMHQKEKQAYRDLFSGLFGLVRNRFAHNNVEATLTELDLVISSVNYCLHLINDFRESPTYLTTGSDISE
jgi:hypothetical protein